MLRDPWSEDVSILSSENVRFGVETAGLGSRFAAALIDIFLQGLVVTLISILSAYIVSVWDYAGWGPLASQLGQAFFILVMFAIVWGYYFVFEWLWDGQTPGKRMLGLRVLHIDGMPLTPWGALVRNIVRVFDFLPLFYGAGALMAMSNANNRRAGDLVAGTIVARERHDAERPVLSIAQAAEAFLQAQSPRQNTPQVLAGPQNAPQVLAEAIAGDVVDTDEFSGRGEDLENMIVAAKLGPGDWELLEDFLARRVKLQDAVRVRLARTLAAQLSAKIGQELPAGEDAENWLQTLATRR